MIYPQSVSPRLDIDLFRNPPAEYRGAPFWAWNGTLNQRRLNRQLEVFKEMGLGGAHMHVRVGLQLPYLSDEFMALIRGCVDECSRLGLRAWLYDEDRWPSGAGGGLVTRAPAYRMKHLLITRTPYAESLAEADPNAAAARSGRSEEGELLRVFAVRLQDGDLDEYRTLWKKERATLGSSEKDDVEQTSPDLSEMRSDELALYVYLELNREIPWFNNRSYLDTLNPEAVSEFIRVTHERYLEVVGDAFGTVIPAIFTDEPQYNQPSMLPTPDATDDVLLPFTTDFDETYREAYGDSFLDRVPEFVWEGSRAGTVRYRFFDHATERFASAFADVIGSWCRKHGIALTGHMMEEPTLHSQTHAVGAAMRSYRGFQLPGIDLLSNRVELTTAKQAQSAARQFGREGVLSELYGVTGWHFDFRGHKLQGDWQTALGITARVPHLAWVTMEGEAKRDYPAAIGCQSPWYHRYRIVEDHFARLNTVLTRGAPVCRVGVIHPIESYWMSWGPESRTSAEREEQDRRFQDLTDWLLRNQIDFDFLDESLLATKGRVEGTALAMGRVSYDVVLLPFLRTIRTSTLNLIECLLENAGDVVVAGATPEYVDGEPSGRASALLLPADSDAPPSSPPAAGSRSTARHVRFSRTAILAALDAYRDLHIETSRGTAATNIIYQLREDGGCRFLFLSHVDPPTEPAIPELEHLVVGIRGSWSLERYDTQDGTVESIESRVAEKGGERWTEIGLVTAAHDSLLIKLTPAEEHDTEERGTTRPGASARPDKLPTRGDPPMLAATPAVATVRELTRRTVLPQPEAYSLSEPNVLLLDTAEWSVDRGKRHREEEVLRLDQKARRLLGWPQRGGRMAQPWVEPDDPDDRHTLTMWFSVTTAVDLDGCSLAVERPSDTVIRLDEHDVPSRHVGYWVDESIRVVPLPPMQRGTHTIEVSTNITRRTGAEWCYLLGSFGVRVAGRATTLEPLPDRLRWGDIAAQGLPFYAGNLTYRVSVPSGSPNSVRRALQVTDFAAPLLDVSLDDRPMGSIAWSPYVLELPARATDVPEKCAITFYGNRQNAFGPVHNTYRHLSWYGPPAWRTRGPAWSYEYRLEPTGILAAPVLLEPDRKR